MDSHLDARLSAGTLKDAIKAVGLPECLEDLLARDDATDESGALKFGDLANIASIGGSIISAVHNIFGG